MIGVHFNSHGELLNTNKIIENKGIEINLMSIKAHCFSVYIILSSKN
jgi:hypothetical protein